MIRWGGEEGTERGHWEGAGHFMVREKASTKESPKNIKMTPAKIPSNSQ